MSQLDDAVMEFVPKETELKKSNEGNLEGKVALVTGGGTGLGKGIAKKFAVHGATVIVTGRRLEPLEETVAEIEAEGGVAVAMQMDVTDEDMVNGCVNDIVEKFGYLDIAISNAGHQHISSIVDLDYSGTDTDEK
eukprot:TRINITY_DN1417_c1_g1_i7.p1 TRINITY_DN1417_c1_g1~~TRINITY_DN1417_c1_g1_i7.p1  ORF type:complete len:135 (-),score=62.03 TRINITY_DN1417_c1_g1_i7:58-462(-)